jgi:polygalacturonase
MTGAAIAAGLGAPRRSSAAPGPPASGVFDIKKFGAVPDGKTPCTAAIQRAVDACGASGGGVVLVPSGSYLSGAIFLRSNIELRISGTILGSPRFDDYPPINGRSEGVERKIYSSLLTGMDLENVTITGPGAIDGQGPPWWQAHEATQKLRLERNLSRPDENPPGSPLKWPRPRVVNLIRCRGVVLKTVTVRDGPAWNIHLVYCEDVVIHDVTAIGLQAPNTDGIVIDSCKQVRISDCALSTGSDSIAIKAGYNEDGRRVGIPCEDIVIASCNFALSNGAGIAIGSETAGGIRNVVISNCTIARARYGIQIKSARGRGGVVERVQVSNVILDQIHDAGVMISCFYDSISWTTLFEEQPSTGNPETDRTMRPPVGEGTPTFRDISIRGLTLGEVQRVAAVEGLPERYIRRVRIQDVMVASAKAGISCAQVVGMTIDGVVVEPLASPAVAARNVEGLAVSGLVYPEPRSELPVIQLESSPGAFIQGCQIGAGPPALVRLVGPGNHDLLVTANHLPPGMKAVG